MIMNPVFPIVLFRSCSSRRFFLSPTVLKGMSLQVNNTNSSFHFLTSNQILCSTGINDQRLTKCLHLQTCFSNVPSIQAHSIKDVKVESSFSSDSNNNNNKNSSNEPEQSGVDNSFVKIDPDISNLLRLRSGAGTFRTRKIYPELASLPIEQAQKRVKYLKQKNIPLSRIQFSPWFILHDSVALEEKVNSISRVLKINFTSAISFIRMSEEEIYSLKLWWYEDEKERRFLKEEGDKYGKNYSNRLEYLSHRLECTIEDAADMIVRQRNFTRMELFRLRNKIDLLKDGGVPLKSIVSHPRLFDHGTSWLSRRVQLFQACQGVMRPSSVFFQRDRFKEKLLKTDKKRTLYDSLTPSIGEYLQNRLECSEEDAQTILRKISFLAAWKDIHLLEDTITYLLQQGFSKTAIIQCPSVLKMRLDILASRIWEFRKRGLEVTSLNLIAVKDWRTIRRRIVLHHRAMKMYKTATTINTIGNFSSPYSYEISKNVKSNKN